MSWLQTELSQTLARTPTNLDRLSSLIEPQWIEQALQATGKASIRRRKLPAEHVVWLVIGLALFRNQPIWHVVRQLQLTLDGPPMTVPSAAVQARQRLGDEPLQQLFALLTSAWTASVPPPRACLACACWPSMGSSGLPRMRLRTASHWGAAPTSIGQHGPGSWPQIRAVCLMDTYRHELLDARLGDMAQGELTLASQLKGCDQSLTVFDRAYFSAAFLLDWHAAGEQRHWLMRAKDNLRHEVVATHAKGDCTIGMPVSPRARQLHPHLPRHWQARFIEVQLGARTLARVPFVFRTLA